MAEIELKVEVSAPTPEAADRLCRVLNGQEIDPWNVVLGAQLAAAAALMSTIKQAFARKSDGGADEAGISWKPLDPKTAAYHRKIPGVSRTAKGILDAAPLRFWRGVFAHTYRRLTGGGSYTASGARGRPRKGEVRAAPVNDADAARKAASLAWALTKKRFGRDVTLIAKYGGRPLKILRDTGELFGSLDTLPGFTNTPGVFSVQVMKKPWHHDGAGVPERAFWPESGEWPEQWIDAMREAYQEALMAALPHMIS